MTISTRILILLLLLSVTKSALAQVFVVQSDDAKFMDGVKVIAALQAGDEIYANKEKDGWLKAVEPNSQQTAWVSKSKVKLKAFTKAQFAEIAQLKEQMVVIEGYVNSSSANTAQLEEAIAWSRSFRSIWNDRHPNAAAAAEYAGLVAQRAGALSRAQTLLEEALQVHLQVYGKKSPDTAAVYISLAELALDRGNLQDAIEHARASWYINREALGYDSPVAIAALIPVANAMERIGDYEDALDKYRIVYRNWEKQYGEEDIRTVRLAAKIAQQLAHLEKVDEATPIYEHVIRLLTEKYPERKQYRALQALRLAAIKLDSSDSKSLDAYRQRIQSIRQEFPDNNRYVRSHQKRIVQKLLQKGETEAGIEILDTVLRDLRSSLRREFWGMNADQQRDYVAYADGYTFFQAISRALDAGFENSFVANRSSEWLINGKGLVQEAQSVQAGGTLDLNKRDLWSNEPWVELADVRNGLADGEVFVDILHFLDFDFDENGSPTATNERYAAWIVKKTGDVQILDLGPAAPIQQAVSQLRAELTSSRSQIKKLRDEAAYEALRPKLVDVSRLIWHPILDACDGSLKITVSPDHSTWLLPWPALLNKDEQTFAVETHQIQLDLSARDLVAAKVSSTNDQAVIFADPVFDAQISEPQPGETRSIEKSAFGVGGRLKLPPVRQLQFSAPEAFAIAPAIEKLVGSPPQTLLQGQALESAFKQLQSPTVVVLSTHGFFLSDSTSSDTDSGGRSLSSSAAVNNMQLNPLLKCGLMMAGANQHLSIDSLENDGVLTGIEIASTDLSSTRLAVLSACETGLGELEAAGGVVGLRRAFHIAGAQSVMSSLWEVPDRDTMILIKGFFESLADSRNVAASLQSAQRQHIRIRRNRFGVAHPFYWAAFNVTGSSEF